MYARSLGVATSAARGITLASATSPSGAPHVATLGANHNIPSAAQNPNDTLRRFAIFGATGGTTLNGIWTLASTGTNTFRAEGSVANGVAVVATNAVVAAVFDRTPFMRGHSAVALATTPADAVAADLTFAVMGNKADATDSEILESNSTTLATYFEDCVSDVAWSVPGPTNDGITEVRNITLRRFMYLNVSAFTAGGVEVDLLV